MTATRRRRLLVGPWGFNEKRKNRGEVYSFTCAFFTGSLFINTFVQLVGVVVKRRSISSALRRDMVPETVAKMLNLDVTVTECGQ